MSVYLLHTYSKCTGVSNAIRLITSEQLMALKLNKRVCACQQLTLARWRRVSGQRVTDSRQPHYHWTHCSPKDLRIDEPEYRVKFLYEITIFYRFWNVLVVFQILIESEKKMNKKSRRPFEISIQCQHKFHVVILIEKPVLATPMHWRKNNSIVVCTSIAICS